MMRLFRRNEDRSKREEREMRFQKERVREL